MPGRGPSVPRGSGFLSGPCHQDCGLAIRVVTRAAADLPKPELGVERPRAEVRLAHLEEGLREAALLRQRELEEARADAAAAQLGAHAGEQDVQLVELAARDQKARQRAAARGHPDAPFRQRDLAAELRLAPGLGQELPRELRDRAAVGEPGRTDREPEPRLSSLSWVVVRQRPNAAA